MRKETGRTQKSTWMQGAAMLTIWWPVLAFICLSIHARIQKKFFDGLLVSSGINGGPSLQDTLYLYREDLLIFGVIVPLLTAVLFVKLRFALAAAISGVLILLVQVLLYANLQSWGQVGSFLTWQALQNAMSFGLSKPEFIGEYISIDGMAKLIALIAFSVAVLVFGRLFWQRVWPIRILGVAGGLSVVAFASMSAFGYSSSMRAAPISDSFVVNAVAALHKDGASPVKAIPENELSALYAQLAGVSLTGYEGPNFAAQKGSNLLIFVMETASIEFLDTRNEIPDHPALNALKDRTYIANNHFSTFPASAEGNLSLLTGTYPPRAIYGTCLIDMPRSGHRLPGPIVQLREAGYQTAIYAPYASQVPADKTVFEGTGFEHVVYGDSLSGSGDADERTVARLTKDVANWGEAKQPFAVALLPQIGHGPWPAALGATVQERGAKLARIQLDWLSQIIEKLRATDQFDNTVIILTGDHGVRTAVEDERVKAGMIDWYAFHVPLLLYAPRADYSALGADMPSSHVDLSAELAELFGLPLLPSYQGLAFHHPERNTRRSFLMAGWYYGANGYRDQRESAMYSDLLEAVYRSDQSVKFGIGELVTDDQSRAAIRDRLSAMASLQESWIAHRLCTTPN